MPDEVLKQRLLPNSWSGGWTLQHNRSKQYLTASKQQLAKHIGLPARTLVRRLNKGKLGFYKSKLRSGMCAYCKQFDEKEEPLITSIENDIIAKLSELQPLFSERWRCHVASKAEYTRPGLQVAASPMYWDAFIASLLLCVASQVSLLQSSRRSSCQWSKASHGT